MSKFAYKVALVQCGYVPVVNGEWTGRASENPLERTEPSPPDQIEEDLRDAGCPKDHQLLRDLGEDGWELVGVVPQSIPDVHILYLKKVVA